MYSCNALTYQFSATLVTRPLVPVSFANGDGSFPVLPMRAAMRLSRRPRLAWLVRARLLADMVPVHWRTCPAHVDGVARLLVHVVGRLTRLAGGRGLARLLSVRGLGHCGAIKESQTRARRRSSVTGANELSEIPVTFDRVPDQVLDQVPDQVPDQAQGPAQGRVPDQAQGRVPDQVPVLDQARCSNRVPKPERRLKSAAPPLLLESALRGLLS